MIHQTSYDIAGCREKYVVNVAKSITSRMCVAVYQKKKVISIRQTST